ncbi:reverse transcriptase [Gossypium australe]|uniref:Reverse transcriptase n=1 Tax=Gossypium australe TaxID=47621 RepID=A0A5B6VUL4_9ROSI|nr:reverse transcriptase [Gossypium australe]
MEFDGEVVKFNIYEAMNRPNKITNVSNVDIIGPLTKLHLEYHDKNELQIRSGSRLNSQFAKRLLIWSIAITEKSRLLKLELKPLLVHLKFARWRKYVAGNNLKDYKRTFAKINGLGPLTCMHKIPIVENAIPKRETQRRLNLPMMEVVRKEVQKVLDAGMIYSISGSN